MSAPGEDEIDIISEEKLETHDVILSVEIICAKEDDYYIHPSRKDNPEEKPLVRPRYLAKITDIVSLNPNNVSGDLYTDYRSYNIGDTIYLLCNVYNLNVGEKYIVSGRNWFVYDVDGQKQPNINGNPIIIANGISMFYVTDSSYIIAVSKDREGSSKHTGETVDEFKESAITLTEGIGWDVEIVEDPNDKILQIKKANATVILLNNKEGLKKKIISIALVLAMLISVTSVNAAQFLLIFLDIVKLCHIHAPCRVCFRRDLIDIIADRPQ
jgi:hypothetical protein